MAYIFNKYLPVDANGNITLLTTPTVGDSSNKAATTAFVGTALTNSSYNPNNVLITGGSVNNTPVGATTPSAAAFTTGTYSGAVTLTTHNITGLLTLSGAIREATRVITVAGNVVASATDGIIIMNKTTAAATQITLPSTPATGRFIAIKDGKGDANSNNITIIPAAGNIDGATSIVLNVAFGALDFIYNGSAWNVLASAA